MRKRTRGAFFLIALLVAVALIAVPWQGAQEETPLPETAGAQALNERCRGTQTMRFTRCGHSVTRRINLPDALRGATFTDMLTYYDQWHIDSASGDAIVMARNLDLFCPMHQVLMCDDMGNVARFINRYGDGMACEERYDRSLASFPESLRDDLAAGIAFDDLDALNQWLTEVDGAR